MGKNVKRTLQGTVRRLLRNEWLSASVRALCQRGYIARAVWMRLPVERQFQVHVDQDHSFKYESIAGDPLGRNLYWRGLGHWEQETTSVFANLARQASLILDIGANTGVFTLISCAVNPHCRALAFEPVPDVFARLQRNVDVNRGMLKQCKCFQNVVTEKPGWVDFHVPTAEGLPSSASLDPHGFRGVSGRVMRVNAIRIDDVVGHDERVDLVKIDVEGFEDHVLRGMIRVLRESSPTIIVECLPDGPYAEVENILRSFGYEFYHLRENGPVKVANIQPDEKSEFRNFLAAGPKRREPHAAFYGSRELTAKD